MAGRKHQCSALLRMAFWSQVHWMRVLVTVSSSSSGFIVLHPRSRRVCTAQWRYSALIGQAWSRVRLKVESTLSKRNQVLKRSLFFREKLGTGCLMQSECSVGTKQQESVLGCPESVYYATERGKTCLSLLPRSLRQSTMLRPKKPAWLHLKWILFFLIY